MQKMLLDTYPSQDQINIWDLVFGKNYSFLLSEKEKKNILTLHIPKISALEYSNIYLKTAFIFIKIHVFAKCYFYQISCKKRIA